MSSACDCKEVYRFPHITYPYSSCICSFLKQHPYFLFIFFLRSFSIRVYSLIINYNLYYFIVHFIL